MLQMMPVISGSGLFDSHLTFPGRGRTDPRTVTEYELEYFTEDGGVSFIGDTAYPVRAGRILLARPGDVRQSQLHFKCLFTHFECRDEALIGLIETLPRVTAVAHPDRYRILFTRLSAAANTADAAAGVQAVSLLLEILFCLLHGHAGNPAVLAPLPALVRTAQQYMDRHYAEPVTVEDVACSCHLSTIYFHRQYTAATGHTPHRYLSDKRIAKAKILLRTEDLSFAEIADACGFGSQSYFCCCFKKQVGCTPGTYKKSVRYPDIL